MSKNYRIFDGTQNLSMKNLFKIILSSALVILLFGFTKSNSSNDASADTSSCTIYPEIGINNLALLKSTFDDVLAQYGEGIVSKKRYGGTDITSRYKAKTIEYPSLGIVFHCEKSNSNEWTLYFIELNENCLCKTEDGNGIGSTYSDLTKEFGEIDYGKGSSIAGKTTEVSMWFKQKISISFIQDGWAEKAEFKTNRITMYGFTGW